MTIEGMAGPGLASLGWDAGWAAAFTAAEAAGGIRRSGALSPARVAAEHRGRYTVATGDAEWSAVLAGRVRHETSSREDLPAVGDWVAVTGIGGGDGAAVIHLVLPRRSAFVRKAAGDATAAQVVAANVDVALIATAVAGDFSARRLERYLTLAWESGAMPVVVLTKADLASDLDSALAEAARSAPGVDVVAVSGLTGHGVEQLDLHLGAGRTAVLLGSSGVGKSTLVNRLLGVERQRTAAVRGDNRGRHTTTHRELIRLASGAMLIDTPGMRELQLWTADTGLESAFADVDGLAGRCRFRDCTHASEPGCAVIDAMGRGLLSRERLAHWHRLRRELAYLARKQDEVAMATERSRVKRLTRGVRSRLRDKYGDA